MLKRICFVALVSLFVVGFGALAGADLVVTDFSDPDVYPGGGQTLIMETDNSSFWDNLMIRSGGVDSIVPMGNWSMGFFKLTPLGFSVIGYANNPSPDIAGEQGYLSGAYSSVLGVGNRPDFLILVHDTNENDKIADIVGGKLVFDEGDDTYGAGISLLFGAGDILFGPDEIRDDLSQLPVYTGTGDSLILPHMIISVEDKPMLVDAVSEPTALLMLGLSGLALKRRRS
jgi:hypothetical protein